MSSLNDYRVYLNNTFYAAYTVLDDTLRRRGFKLFRDGLIGKIITFAEVTLAWIFFRASSASEAIRYIKMMFLNHKNVMKIYLT